MGRRKDKENRVKEANNKINKKKKRQEGKMLAKNL
jgi:hypothetical protein